MLRPLSPQWHAHRSVSHLGSKDAAKRPPKLAALAGSGREGRIARSRSQLCYHQGSTTAGYEQRRSPEAATSPRGEGQRKTSIKLVQGEPRPPQVGMDGRARPEEGYLSTWRRAAHTSIKLVQEVRQPPQVGKGSRTSGEDVRLRTRQA